MSSVIKAKNVVHVSAAEGEGSRGPVLVGDDGERERARIVARAALHYAPLARFALRKAQRIVEEAEEEAASVVADAEARRDDVVAAARREGLEAGREAGLEEGLAEGRARGREELRRELDVLRRATEETRRLRTELIAGHARDVADLAVAVAGRLLRNVGGLDAETARRLVLEMLPRTVGSETVTVRLHPDDLDALRSELGTMRTAADQDSTVDFVPDERLGPGDVTVETDRGHFDGTAAVRARKLVEHLLGVVDHEG